MAANRGFSLVREIRDDCSSAKQRGGGPVPRARAAATLARRFQVPRGNLVIQLYYYSKYIIISAARGGLPGRLLTAGLPARPIG